mgnify:CR=1 FL=1
MLTLHNVTKSFNKTKVLDDLSIQISSGDRIGILGSNGSGKSTLLKIILGLLRPDSGIVEKKDIHIGYASQNSRSFYMRLTAHDNLLFFSSIYKKRDSNKIKSRINCYAKNLSISNLLDKKMFDLSKGEMQKIMFLRSLINDPELILFDEAFVNIDKDSKESFIEFLNNHLKPFQAVLWVTHDEKEAFKICNKYINLNDKKSEILSR